MTDQPPAKSKKDKPMLPFGEYKDLVSRKVKEETCQKFGYYVGQDENGKTVHVAQYRNADGQIIGQKVRYPDKTFRTTGSFGDVTLFGQHLWKQGGRRIAVVEGEIDALSLAQALGTWPVVSVPHGAQGAKKAIQKNLEFLEGYETVVFMFDNDEPGEKAARECADLLTPGKAAIATLPLKDASDMLVAGRVKELTTAFWEAQVRRPDGIINGADLWDDVNREVARGIAYPWPKLDEVTYGQHKGTITTWTSGSGMGKSALVREVEYDLLMKGYRVGSVRLEENKTRTARGLLGLHLNKPIHLPGVEVAQEEMRAAFDATLGTGRFFMLDHFGSLESDNLLSKIRYLAKGCDVDFIILDHISIVVSGMDIAEDERRSLDILMTRLRSTVEETGVGMHLVSHLKRPDGKALEEGGQTSLSLLRGSGSIAQLSDFVIGAERNQQATSETRRNTTMLRVLKNRLSGDTGPAGYVFYDKDTGRLTEVTDFDEGEDDDGETPDF